MVDGILWPREIGNGGEFWGFGFYEGPVLFPFGTLFDPVMEGLFFGRGELVSGIGRRHDLVRILVKDPMDQVAFVGFARNDDREPVAVSFGVLFLIEPELRFASLGIGPVTGKASV